MPTTSSVRNVDTLTFPPNGITLPKMDTEDYLGRSVRDILDILNKPKNQLPFLTHGEATMSAIGYISKLLQ